MADVSLADLPPMPKASVPAGALPSMPRNYALASVDTPLVGDVEAAAHVGSEMAAQVPAALASAYELATSPSGERVQNARRAIGAVDKALTYEPRTRQGRERSELVDTLSGLLPAGFDEAAYQLYQHTGSEALGATADVALQSIPIVFGMRAGGMEATEDQAAAAARTSARAVYYIEHEVGLKWDQLSDGFKAAMLHVAKEAEDLKRLDPAAVRREALAASQEVPVPISRGQATRDLGQITKEENLRKSETGKPLRDLMAAQDDALYANLDVLRGKAAPGSKVATATDVGRSVQTAVRKKLDAARENVDRLYERARRAGEGELPADISPLSAWLKEPANARNASFLASALKDYGRTQKTTGARIDTSTDVTAAKNAGPGEPSVSQQRTVTINDLEKIRQEAVARSFGQHDAQAHYAGQAVKVIDGILDKSGGQDYRQARAAYRAMDAEFKRQGIIRKLSGEKARTSDRAVALEDTLRHVVIGGSAEDLGKVKQVLSDTPDGRQAWADLQAGTIDYLKDVAGGRRGIEGERGQAQFDSSFLDALHDLDQDGKLDLLFGKDVAERVRLLAQTVHDVRTTPAGRISGSDSVPRIMNLLNKARYIPGLHPILREVAAKLKDFKDRGQQRIEAQQAARAPVAEAGATRAPSKVGSAIRHYGPAAAVAGAEGNEEDQSDNIMQAITAAEGSGFGQ